MKGQITIIAFIAVILDLIILAALAPIINAITDILITALGTDAVSVFLARLIMPVLLFGIIFGALNAINFARQTGQW